jgi:2-polyprenyl-3-methyl-5-hydroxy-6-metoxy-1,4-benzoquinol methylase
MATGMSEQVKDKSAAYYDKLYRAREVYHKHYSDTFYFVQWVQVEMMLRPFKNKNILEIGCGPGQLAHYLQDKGYSHYRGFDFSAEAIDRAKNTCTQTFFTGDAFDPALYTPPTDAVVCLEVLEHLENDIDVLKLIKEGTFIIIGVPNFDDPGHVRWFRNQYQIRKRYFKYIDIKKIYFINNIYLFSGTRSNFKPGLFQLLFATREQINISSFLKRLKHRIVHLFKIKHT